MAQITEIFDKAKKLFDNGDLNNGYTVKGGRIFHTYYTNHEWNEYVDTMPKAIKDQFDKGKGGEMKEYTRNGKTYPPKMASYGSYLKSKETITIGDKEYGEVCTYPLSDTTAANIIPMIKAAFFDNPPIIRKNSEKVETGQPVIGITCYSKGKNVYSKRICHEIDYLFSSEYLNLIEELKLLNQRCQAAEN